jgi:hypothetical protein
LKLWERERAKPKPSPIILYIVYDDARHELFKCGVTTDVSSRAIASSRISYNQASFLGIRLAVGQLFDTLMGKPSRHLLRLGAAAREGAVTETLEPDTLNGAVGHPAMDSVLATFAARTPQVGFLKLLAQSADAAAISPRGGQESWSAEGGVPILGIAIGTRRRTRSEASSPREEVARTTRALEVMEDREQMGKALALVLSAGVPLDPKAKMLLHTVQGDMRIIR